MALYRFDFLFYEYLNFCKEYGVYIRSGFSPRSTVMMDSEDMNLNTLISDENGKLGFKLKPTPSKKVVNLFLAQCYSVGKIENELMYKTCNLICALGLFGVLVCLLCSVIVSKLFAVGTLLSLFIAFLGWRCSDKAQRETTPIDMHNLILDKSNKLFYPDDRLLSLRHMYTSVKTTENSHSNKDINLEHVLDELQNESSIKSLIETKSDIEREIFFAHHLQDSETAKSVHRQFNKQYVWPARKKALQDEIEKSDLTTTDKQMFADKLDSFGEEMSEQSVTSFSQELKKFQEQHIRKQNHIKYEGRLSNKDIQSIKEYHGYICMGCGLNPATEYGEQMKYMLEAHHKKPWGQMEENSSRVVSPEDFLILCPNCHKIIHKLESADDLETLQGIVRNK